MSADGTGESQAGPPPAIPLTRRVSAPAGSGEWALQEQSKSRRARVSFMSNDVASSVSLPPSPDTPSHLLFVQQHEVDCNKLEARREGYTFGKNGHRAQERRRTADHAHHAQAQAHAQTSAHAHAQTQAQLRMAQLQLAHDQARGSFTPGSPTRRGVPPGAPDYPRLPQGSLTPGSPTRGGLPPGAPDYPRSPQGAANPGPFASSSLDSIGSEARPAPPPAAAAAPTAPAAPALWVPATTAAPAAPATTAAPAAPEDAAAAAARRLRERSASLLWRPPGTVQAPLFVVGMGDP